jgi:cytochrome c biogenesis protein ResB
MVGLYMAFFLAHNRVWLFLPRDPSEEIVLAGNTNKNKQAFTTSFAKLESAFAEQLVDQAFSDQPQR